LQAYCKHIESILFNTQHHTEQVQSVRRVILGNKESWTLIKAVIAECEKIGKDLQRLDTLNTLKGISMQSPFTIFFKEVFERLIN